MGRRIEAGPLVVALGAVLLLVSLFLDWYSPGANAWQSFEALDLVLAAIALGGLAAAAGLIAPEIARLDRRWLGPLAVAAVIVVGSQIIDPPPVVGDGDTDSGAWLALAAALLMAAGALLSFSRVKLAFTVEGRDPRQRVAAVDARHGGGADDDDAAAAAETERLAPQVPAQPAAVRPHPAAVPPPPGGDYRGPGAQRAGYDPAARAAAGPRGAGGQPGPHSGAGGSQRGSGPHPGAGGGYRGPSSGPPYGR
ncbi:MAG TPA: hypothetical protein VF533_01660 [Solirubrobacteraceae bacterium]|jgi:hypothetical protein